MPSIKLVIPVVVVLMALVLVVRVLVRVLAVRMLMHGTDGGPVGRPSRLCVVISKRT